MFIFEHSLYVLKVFLQHSSAFLVFRTKCIHVDIFTSNYTGMNYHLIGAAK